MRNNEIRIGNWIKGNGIKFQVDESTFSKMKDDDDRFTGIELTDEVLRKCRFDGTIPFFIYENWERIKYLHHLQNLYFDLTFGEELIITEKI